MNVEVIEAIPSSTKKRCSIGRPWIFDLMPHLKCHRFEGKALDDAVVHMLQQRVLKLAQVNYFSVPAVSLTALVILLHWLRASLCSTSNIVCELLSNFAD